MAISIDPSSARRPRDALFSSRLVSGAVRFSEATVSSGEGSALCERPHGRIDRASIDSDRGMLEGPCVYTISDVVGLFGTSDQRGPLVSGGGCSLDRTSRFRE